ncbi:DUF4168 domain-containing protein [Nodosilinea sp. LEGE 07088]|uniref:DUF4168 domain-containing protein n=1 Tax=Nodosilinea sp. LEGE 07088 TaxID=2777968 RepID=UPI00187F3D8D|nr:DUF4168 domain-containing protein [Nodosilinea sp. LEGE 07088]MBE9140489.1 DUF4168 domain-containing protein [Nodosilinea sp. LEGE 07088]
MKPSTLLKGLLAATLILGAPAAAVAQEQTEPAPSQAAPIEVSENQIDNFVSAYQAIQNIQQAVQPEIVAAVEAEGLTVDDYNAIAAAQQSPDTAADIDPTQAEQFAAATEQIAALQANAGQEMEAAIEAEDLTVDEFEQILAQAQQDPALQQAITERLAGDE